MAVDQIPESTNFPDSFWLEHGEQIRTVSKVIEAPKTRVGEEIQKNLFNNPIFMVYKRLHPIFSSLVTLVEYDEIGKAEGKSYFSEPTNQGIVLRAIKLLVEDSIKFPYSGEEKKKYEDYHKFFGGALSRLGQLDKQIQAGQKLPNFVNSLVMIISQETSKLKGLEDFGMKQVGMKIERIRERIADYLPQLAQVNNGELLSGIQDQLEMPLAGVNSTGILRKSKGVFPP